MKITIELLNRILLINFFSIVPHYSFSCYLSFSSAIISFINFSCSFNLDFFCLVGSVPTSGVGSRAGLLCKFFIGNNMLLKLLRTFSLAINNK